MKKLPVLTILLFLLGMHTGKAQYVDIHGFNDTLGSSPMGSLTRVENTLFGTTYSGGTYNRGVIFSVSTNGSNYKVLNTFNSTNGAGPYDIRLTPSANGKVLYGMTLEGGLYNNAGVIFSIDTGGTNYKVIFNFNGTDGSAPQSDLLLVGGKLYGETTTGGVNNEGCIFSVDTNGSGYRNLYNFSVLTGGHPTGNLVLSGNVFYGTTYIGGQHNLGCIFSIDTNGSAYDTLHSFGSGHDGVHPALGVVLVGKRLYGMTNQGGPDSIGTVFAIDTNGARYAVLLNFYGSNGYAPNGGLTPSGNKLYGMTSSGGIGALAAGCIFSIDTDGSNYTNMFSFQYRDSLEGAQPYGSLLSTGNALYGMSYYGGSSIMNLGEGAIFKYSDTNLCSNNYSQPICIVTLDTATNKCEIVWGRSNSPAAGGYGSFNVYRDTGAGYAMIHSQALNVLSEYIDTGSNPSAGPVSYELSTTDSCGQSALSSPHTSIYLTTTAGVGVYILNWTAYVGFTPTEYIIYRGASLSSIAPIDTVSNATLTFHDTLPPLGSYYVVEAVSPYGPCVPTTHRAGSFSLLSGAFSNGFNTGTLLGISSLANNLSALKLYPNPSNGMFTLSYTMSGSDNVTISIINELGQQVYTEQKHANSGPVTEQLNAGNLASGIYMLRIQTSKGISVQKLSIMQ